MFLLKVLYRFDVTFFTACGASNFSQLVIGTAFQFLPVLNHLGRSSSLSLLLFDNLLKKDDNAYCVWVSFSVSCTKDSIYDDNDDAFWFQVVT